MQKKLEKQQFVFQSCGVSNGYKWVKDSLGSKKGALKQMNSVPKRN